LPEIKTPDDCDSLDLEIIAALEVNPKTPCRIIAEKTGKGTSTIWDRIQRIRRSDWVEQMRDDLRSLGGIALEAVQDGMSNGDASDRAGVSLRLLNGLGALEDKRSVSINIADATPDQVRKWLRSNPEFADGIAGRTETNSA
jgi:hypothetical protein